MTLAVAAVTPLLASRALMLTDCAWTQYLKLSLLCGSVCFPPVPADLVLPFVCSDFSDPYLSSCAAGLASSCSSQSLHSYTLEGDKLSLPRVTPAAEVQAYKRGGSLSPLF